MSKIPQAGSNGEAAFIPLTKGQFAIIDVADYENLAQWKWRAFWNKNTNSFYAVRSGCRDGKRCCIMMHRFLLGLDGGRHNPVDHGNHDTLDNRRNNLRVCSMSENKTNSRTYKNNTTGHKGVFIHPSTGKWRARIWCKGRSISLGLHETKEEAIKAWRSGVEQHHGKFLCS